jgi:5-methylcytosine-specific restriction endonuclease McrA
MGDRVWNSSTSTTDLWDPISGVPMPISRFGTWPRRGLLTMPKLARGSGLAFWLRGRMTAGTPGQVPAARDNVSPSAHTAYVAHVRIFKPCEQCGESFTLKGLQTVERQQRARFCSYECRNAAGRRDVVCQHCGKTFNLKANLAAKRRFCSRGCMQAAWGCAFCAVLVSDERRANGEKYCSARCSLSAHLETEALLTGVLHAACGRCERILPSSAFTKERCNRNGLSGTCKECRRTYYEANQDQFRRRRYESKAAPGGALIPFTSHQKAERFSMWGGRCWVCGVADATQDDHVKPISLGGSHCLSNLRPICVPCNASKGSKWPLTGAMKKANFRHPAPRSGSDAGERTPRLPREPWTCPQCGKTKLIRACDARNRKFCSKECTNAAKTLASITKVCGHCGKEFVLPGHEGSKLRQFCSLACGYAGRRRWDWRRREAGFGQSALF